MPILVMLPLHNPIVPDSTLGGGRVNDAAPIVDEHSGNGAGFFVQSRDGRADAFRATGDAQDDPVALSPRGEHFGPAADRCVDSKSVEHVGASEEDSRCGVGVDADGEVVLGS
jgi:hypothetical protein